MPMIIDLMNQRIMVEERQFRIVQMIPDGYEKLKFLSEMYNCGYEFYTNWTSFDYAHRNITGWKADWIAVMKTE